VAEYNQPAFIGPDPISISHRFSLKQDIEISGFFAALFAWGNRTTIINKSLGLMHCMGGTPYAFVMDPDPEKMRALLSFRHRTFNATDILYLLEFLQHHYRLHDSLETAFSQWMDEADETVEKGLAGFYPYVFSLPDAPSRTRKHIASPEKGSTCKRLAMYLRWMVRSDDKGVDFGIWKKIRPSQLVCPVDLHVARVARRFGLITRNQADWATVLELTDHLRRFDPQDPVKYDFALFALGVIEKF
jgi:uncharacterized protein (TIGR02757 family)